MPGRLKRTDVEAACEDLRNRTLAKIVHEIGRLIYLASTRDYNTGRYYHDGLAFQFSEEVAERALAQAHQEVFLSLALGSLENLANELRLYFCSLGPDPKEIIQTWEKLEPYRVTIPIDSNPLMTSLFLSNIRIALAIVASLQQTAR